jgi:ABC-type transporter MlaC component
LPWLLTLPLYAAAADPRGTVVSAMRDVLAAMEDPDIARDAQWQRVMERIARDFDFVAMTRRILDTHWMDANEEQRARVTTLFRQLLSITYWRRIAAYRGEQVVVIATELREVGLATARTLVYAGHADHPIDYKLEEADDRWLADDVVIEQISLVRHCRGTFLDTVRAHKIDGLIAELEWRLENSAADG